MPRIQLTTIARDRMFRTGAMVALVAGLVGAAAPAAPAGGAPPTCDASVATPVPQPTAVQMAAAGLDALPVAPDAARVDLVAGPFSDPTTITNPLFPISDLHSAVLNGHVDGLPFRTETTLLPETKIIEWTDGQCVEVLVSQYTAYLGGRLEEVALDYYAQADDGSVWYFGEDVFNYNARGRIADTDGTWLAGKEGPVAMIMPFDPQLGEVNRPENIPGLVFEEVTAKLIDQTVDGPSGPVTGVLVAEELHDDGSFSDKVFAPGYGEFSSAHEGDLEAMAVASPVDALGGGVPAELSAIATATDALFASRPHTDAQWAKAEERVAAIEDAWTAFRAGDVPPRLVRPTTRAIARLAARVNARDAEGKRSAAVDVAYANLDLQLRYRPVAEVDLARFEQWARRVVLHSSAGSLGGVTADLATMEWIRDRFVHTLDPVDVTRIDYLLGQLRNAVVDQDLGAAAATARELRALLEGLI